MNPSSEEPKKKEPQVTSEAPVMEEMNMEQLLAEAEREQSIVGSLVSARVVEVGSSGVLVDVGLKGEGFIPLAEFHAVPTPPKAGDVFPVVVKKTGGPDGHLLVSWKEARDRAAWPAVQAAKDAGATIEAKVLRAVKGGLIVDVGLEAFLPASQADRRPVRDFASFLGTTVSVQIIEMDAKKGNVVVSRRALLEKAAEAKREEILKTISAGQVFTGTVTGLTDFGAFVDIGGVEGLVRLPDISWRRIGKPSEELKTGQKVEVKVLKFDAATKKISLGRKQLLPHPWDDIEAKFPAGRVVEGKVTNVTEFGAFVELAPGIEGLIHKSEFAWEEREVKPADRVKAGQKISVWVLSVNRAEERISLSLKRAGENPWQAVAVKFPVGSKVKGTVARLAEFGAFINLGGGIEGLLRVEDLSWTKRVAHPKDVLAVGQEVELKVLEVNTTAEKLALGLKQMSQDPYGKFKMGAVVEGKVIRLSDHGAFVEIEPGVEAFLHVSEISESRLNHPSEALKEGDSVTACVLKVQAKPKRIDISIRKHDRDEERKLLKRYRPSQEGPSMAEVAGWDKIAGALSAKKDPAGGDGPAA